jgi:hypothetical protein
MSDETPDPEVITGPEPGEVDYAPQPGEDDAPHWWGYWWRSGPPPRWLAYERKRDYVPLRHVRDGLSRFWRQLTDVTFGLGDRRRRREAIRRREVALAAAAAVYRGQASALAEVPTHPWPGHPAHHVFDLAVLVLAEDMLRWLEGSR